MKKIELEKQLESYYEDCEFRKRLNEKTIKAYTIDLNQYLEFITTTEINQKIINEYIHYLNKKYLKYKTIKRKIASVKAFYSYLEYEEIIDYSPFNKIKTKIKELKQKQNKKESAARVSRRTSRPSVRWAATA